MNAHTPFDAKQDWSNPYCQNSSNDQIVDSLLGNAYHVVRTVYCNLGNLKLLYDFLNQYGMVIGVQSEAELKALTADAKYARIYGFSRAGDRQVTDYLYVEGDRTGILPDDTTATGSWVTAATSGSNSGGTSSGDGAYIPWVYNKGSAIGGETTINVPDGTVGVPFIIINGDMQYVGRGFEFNVDSLSVTLAQSLEEGDEVVFLLTGVPAVPDNPYVNDWVQINWLYNNGAAVGGEQVIAIPYTFQSVPAVYKNGLRLYKGLTTESYTADPDSQRILLTEPLATNDRLIVQIGGEARVLEASDYTLQEVARAANVKDSEVILSTDTTQVLNGKKIIYDVVSQHIYGLPTIPTNVYITSVSDGQLTYSPGNITVTLLDSYQQQNTRELWRRSLVEAGLTLVDGSFEAGASVNSKTDAVWYVAGAQCYTWDAVGTKIVPAKSTPESTGGIGPGKWVGVGDASLRSDLAKPDGAKLMWAAPGRTQADKNKDIISVLDKGADPTGATDSTSAFLAAGHWALVPPGLYLVDPAQVSLKNCWGPGKLKYTTDGSEHWCGFASKGTLYIRNDDRNGDGTPVVPGDGLINLADGELKFLCDLDGDGDYDADIYGQNNLYIAAETSVHFRIAPQTPQEGRVRIAATENTNFIQSGKDYAGTTLKNLAFGPYRSTDYWAFISQSSGYMVIGNSASPLAPLHVFNSRSTPAVFENTSSSRSRVGFKGSTTTSGTSVSAGANGNDFEVRAGGAEKLVVTADGFVRPATANAQYCGSNPFPWAGGYTQTAFTITSDADCKSDPMLMTDVMLDAWGEVGWVQYKYLDRIEAKGEDGARWHFGLIAQRVKEAFERHGLDTHRFGFLCYDEWDDVYESVQTNNCETVLVTREVTRPATKEIETYQDTLVSDEAGDRVVRERVKKTIPLTRKVPVVDERGIQLLAADGSPLFSRVDVMETVTVKEEVPAEPVYKQVLVRPAGKRYGIRYEEAFAIEAAYQRRNFMRLQKRIEALENQ